MAVGAVNAPEPMGTVESIRTKPIVVAVDGSRESATALAWAAGHAAMTGDRLRLVTSYEQPYPTTGVAGEYWRELLVAKRSARLEAKVVIADVLGRAEVDHVLQMGSVESVLVEASRDASLVVVGTRTSTSWWSRFRGTVSDRIKGDAACPVVSIPLDAAVTEQPVAV